MGTCTHGHMYTFTHEHMGTCTHVHMGTCTHLHMYTCTHLHMSTWVHGYMGTWAHRHMYTRAHVHTGTWAQTHNMGTWAHVCCSSHSQCLYLVRGLWRERHEVEWRTLATWQLNGSLQISMQTPVVCAEVGKGATVSLVNGMPCTTA